MVVKFFMGCFEWNTSLFKHLRDLECTLWGSIIPNPCIPIQASLLVDLRCEEMLFHNVVFLEVLIAYFTLEFWFYNLDCLWKAFLVSILSLPRDVQKISVGEFDKHYSHTLIFPHIYLIIPLLCLIDWLDHIL